MPTVISKKSELAGTPRVEVRVLLQTGFSSRHPAPAPVLRSGVPSPPPPRTGPAPAAPPAWPRSSAVPPPPLRRPAGPPSAPLPAAHSTQKTASLGGADPTQRCRGSWRLGRPHLAVPPMPSAPPAPTQSTPPAGRHAPAFARSPPPPRTLHALLLTASPHSAAAPQVPTLHPIPRAPHSSQPIFHNLSASLKEPCRMAATRCRPRANEPRRARPR